MSNASISVVTPSYNQSEFIEETIQSVANQNYNGKEHIVVDGNSDDGTQELLKKHDDKLEWISEEDEGQADAINKGFRRATGDIVGWLNSDDVYFDVNVFSRIADYFENTEADIIYGDMALIDSDSNIMKFSVLPDFNYNSLLRSCFIVQPSLFFKKEVIKNNKLNSDLDYVMDYEFWLRLAQKYDFRHISDVLSADRNHANRKILDQRNEMKSEGRRVRQIKYNMNFNIEYKIRRLSDILFSGVPRSILSAKCAYKYYQIRPELAFPGRYNSLPQLVKNSFLPNKNLI